jgi:hypothetical protein
MEKEILPFDSSSEHREEMKKETLLIEFSSEQSEHIRKILKENGVSIYADNSMRSSRMREMNDIFLKKENENIAKNIMLEWAAGLNFEDDITMEIIVKEDFGDENSYSIVDVVLEDKILNKRLLEFYNIEHNIDLLGQKNNNFSTENMKENATFVLLREEIVEFF